VRQAAKWLHKLIGTDKRSAFTSGGFSDEDIGAIGLCHRRGYLNSYNKSHSVGFLTRPTLKSKTLHEQRGRVNNNIPTSHIDVVQACNLTGAIG
jgi:hypothetical protein